MKYSKLFITGCDENTEWMLPWFINNYYDHNDTPLRVIDFGMSKQMKNRYQNRIIEFDNPLPRWFKKPAAMKMASGLSEYTCWLDTDCEVRSEIGGLFTYVEPNKLAMGVDQPWTTRRGEPWHNSGVVAFAYKPVILDHWAHYATQATHMFNNPMYGDQDILHELVSVGLNRHIHITTLPKMFNTLRLDLLDNTIPDDIKIMHWTGKKGKDEIRKQMNE